MRRRWSGADRGYRILWLEKNNVVNGEEKREEAWQVSEMWRKKQM